MSRVADGLREEQRPFLEFPAGKTPAGRPGKSKARKSSRRVCILILGMHRSGTSAFARVLNLLGCDLPRTVVQAHEMDGTQSWQSDAIRQLNDRILASAGSQWADWLEFNPGWLDSPRSEEFREEALALVLEEFGSSRLFVLDDPRICRLVPFWLGVLKEAGAQPLIISPVRSPVQVAAALEEQDGFEAGLGHLLWLRHVLDAEFASRGTDRFFTSYDRLATGWARTATQAESTLGIAWPRISEKAAVEIEAFLADNNHRFQQSVDSALDNPTLSDWLRGSFEILGRWSTTGENPQDFAALDRIRAALNIAAPAFSRLLSAEEEKISRLNRELESRLAAAKAAEQVLAEIRSKLAAAEETAAAEQEKATRLETELGRERQRLGETDQQIAKLKGELETELGHERQRLGETDQQIAKLKGELESRAGAARKAEQALVEAESKRAAAEKATAAEQEKAARLETELGRERQRLGETEQQIRQLKSELESWTGAARVAEEELTDTRTKLSTAEATAVTERDKASRLELELSDERQRLAAAEQQTLELNAELEGRTHAAEQAEVSLKELRHQLAQTESALAQRRHEAEETARELAVTREELRKTAEARNAAESVSAGLKEHVLLLMADLKERQAALSAVQHTGAAESATMAKQVKRVLAVLETSRHEIASRLAEAERAMKQQADEIEALKAQVEEKRGEAHHEREKAGHLRQVAASEIGAAVAGLLNGHSSPLLKPFRLRRQVAILRSSGLFNAEWYLQEYTDVAEAGMDPLRHYLEYGAKEGRAPNPALARLNGKA